MTLAHLLLLGNLCIFNGYLQEGPLGEILPFDEKFKSLSHSREMFSYMGTNTIEHALAAKMYSERNFYLATSLRLADCLCVF
jgi:hypothetical protein